MKVSSGTTMRVPIVTQGSQDGGVQVWVTMHAGADLKVGLDGPDGTWVSPVDAESSGGKDAGTYNAAVYNGSQASGSPVPAQSHGAAVLWQGSWPSGTYYITLSGTGTADLFLQGTGDAGAEGAVGFANGVREGTINLPATNPSIIGVGCTINKASWQSIHGVMLGLSVPVLDAAGGIVDSSGATRDAVSGEPCWFSSAGPTLTGVQKPEILAPGAAIIGALSSQAVPPGAASIFTNSGCPTKNGTSTDPDCQQIDSLHGVSFGTSFSSPIVAGTIAILFQHDPTLTQDAIVAALQGGAHKLRGAAPFDDQAGPGEVDVMGAISAVDAMRQPSTALPALAQSWMTLGADEYLADGSTTLEAIVELRTASSAGGSEVPADGFAAGRLAAYTRVDGAPYDGGIQSFVRRGPGVWVATVQLQPGLGGSSLTIGTTFDGTDIVAPRSVPIATDTWTAGYLPSVRGGCGVAAHPAGRTLGALGVGVFVAAIARRRRRRQAG